MSSTILIVDDEEPVLDLIAEALTAAGYKAVTAASGLEALKLMSELLVDLLIADAYMPHVDGLEFVAMARIKQAGLPTVVMSGYQIDLNDERWQDHDVAAFLAKPFTPLELRSTVAEALLKAS